MPKRTRKEWEALGVLKPLPEGQKRYFSAAEREDKIKGIRALAEKHKGKRVKTLNKEELEVTIQYRPFPHQAEVMWHFRSGKRFVAMVTGIQAGKCLEKGQGVLLSDGRTVPAGRLRLGDEVLGMDGGLAVPTTVTGLEKAIKECVEVRLHSGQVLRVSLDHRFPVQFKNKIRNLPIGEILDKKFRYLLVAANVRFCSRRLPVSPYLLGVLLGDGGLTSGRIELTTEANEIVEAVSAQAVRHGVRLRAHKPSALQYTLSVSCGRRNPLKKLLADLGLMGKGSWDKFIPHIYKIASEEERLELLAGLVDTDGYVQNNTSVEYCTMSARLAEDVVFVVRSLGGRASVSRGHVGQYRVRFALNKRIPTRIAYKTHWPSYRYNKSLCGIKSWKPLGLRECVHVKVACPSHEFVLDGFIRTHNSTHLAYQPLHWIYGQSSVQYAKRGLGWIVSPTYPMSLVMERAFEQAASAVILKKRRNPTEYLLRPPMVGGAPYLIQIKTAENHDRLRGAVLDWVECDEAAMMDEETIDILMGRVLTTSGPMLIGTTPRGMQHWLFHDWAQKAEAGHPDYAIVRARTSDNPLHNADDLARLREKYGEEFALQELEGEFINLTGLVYKDFSAKDHVRPLSELPVEFDEMIAGIDWGFDDPFVFLWLGRKGPVWYLLHEYYKRQEIPRIHLEAVKAHWLTPKLSAVYADVSRPESREEFQGGLSMPVLPGRSEKDDMIPGIEYISSLFAANRLIIASHCLHTLDELRRYSWRVRKDRNSKDRPVDAFNHAMDALRYALYSHRNAGPARSIVRIGGQKIVTTTQEEAGKLRLIKRVMDYKKRFMPKKHWMSG